MRKVLVTGGGGYLARLAAEFLMGNGFQVRLASRFPIENIEEGIEANLINWGNSSSIDNAVQDCTDVIHLSSMDSIGCSTNPTKCFQVNFDNTVNLIDACKKNKIRTFIYVSTVHVYDSDLNALYDEQSKTLNTHPYAKSHSDAESYILNSRDMSEDFHPIVLRASNCFGFPKNTSSSGWNLFVNDCIRQAKNYLTIKIESNPNTLRDFIPVELLLKALIHSLNNYRILSHNTYNISSGNSRSLLEVAEIIKSAFKDIHDYDIEIKLTNMRNNSSCKRLKIDNTKIVLSGLEIKDTFHEDLYKFVKKIIDA